MRSVLVANRRENMCSIWACKCDGGSSQIVKLARSNWKRYIKLINVVSITFCIVDAKCDRIGRQKISNQKNKEAAI